MKTAIAIILILLCIYFFVTYGVLNQLWNIEEKVQHYEKLTANEYEMYVRMNQIIKEYERVIKRGELDEPRAETKDDEEDSGV